VEEQINFVNQTW